MASQGSFIIGRIVDDNSLLEFGKSYYERPNPYEELVWEFVKKKDIGVSQ